MRVIIVDNMRDYDYFISECNSKELIENAIIHFGEGKNIIKLHGVTFDLRDDYHLYAVDDLRLLLYYCE